MSQAVSTEAVIIGIGTLLLLATAILTVCERIRLPFTVMLVLAGAGLSWLAERYAGLTIPLGTIQISPDLILYVFLPTLIFESAFSLDGRLLLKNIWPVLTLAVPGVLVSTAIIGAIMASATPIPVMPALLLGAILSATDPVSVIALFKELGAPARLTMLVEGESLLNDASSIVVARIFIGLIAGSVAITIQTVAGRCLDMILIFVGGFFTGWLLGMAAGWLFGKIRLNQFVQITLTTVLAYGSYLFAERVLHASGVVSTMGAGLALGGWGKEKITPSVRTYLEQFWGYMAFIANALLFLLVGLRVHLAELWNSIGPLVWVGVAMLVSRAVVVYGLVPLVTAKERVDLRRQTIIFWGGLRGGIAIALALSLPPLAHTENFVALVLGAALFTLVAHGLTIEPMLKLFKLDTPPLVDRFAGLQTRLAARQEAAERIPELARGGLYSGRVTERLVREYASGIAALRLQLENLRQSEIGNPGIERSVLFLLAFADEKAFFMDMLDKGHIRERTFKEHAFILARQGDAVRYGRPFPFIKAGVGIGTRVHLALLTRIGAVRLFSKRAERLRRWIISMKYEESWARQMGTAHLLARIDEMAQLNAISTQAAEMVRSQYIQWNRAAKKELDGIAEQFPEFVLDMQERLGRRLLLYAEAESVKRHEQEGLVPKGMAEGICAELYGKIEALKGAQIARLIIDPSELLRKVPFFREIPQEEFAAIAGRMRPRTAIEDEVIIHQGESGSSLFMIARGVVRVSRTEGGTKRDIATLMAGEFFGEMALLHQEPRNATVRAVTSCCFYELSGHDLDAVCAVHPSIRRALEVADAKRKAELQSSP